MHCSRESIRPMSKEKSKTTEFSCHVPDDSGVFLAGTFNDWQMDATPMTKDAQGTWKANLELPSGRHEFKFVVNGDWCCEPGCDETNRDCPKCEPNSFGSMNRVVDVA